VKILVTGAGGFISSVLIPSLLRAGHIVTGLDDLRLGGHGLLSVYGDPNFTFCKGSVNDVALTRLITEEQDAVIHLAALVGEPPCNKWPKEAETVNVCGTTTMLEAAKSAGVKHFLFSSTCSNYGKQPGGELTEDAPLVPLSLYAETKIRAEREVLAANMPNMATTVFRFATAFGVSPRMRFDTLLNEFVRDATVNGFLLVYGRDSFRTLVHVRDIVQMVQLTLEKRKECAGEVFNVGGEHVSKGGLVHILQKYLPDLDVDFKEQRGDPRDYKASFAKALKLGYKPRYTVEDGVLEVMNAIQDGLFSDCNSSLYRNVP
jgi:nucleoside-diphosphate-sugar epimerase